MEKGARFVCVYVCLAERCFLVHAPYPPNPPTRHMREPGIKAHRRPAPGFHRYPTSAAGQSVSFYLVQNVHSEPTLASSSSTASYYSKSGKNPESCTTFFGLNVVNERRILCLQMHGALTTYSSLADCLY
jgi:hypothetical protein